MIDVDHFQRRIIEDAFQQSWRMTWARAARRFEDARPRPGDYLGGSTIEQQRAKWRELTEIAAACRAHG